MSVPVGNEQTLRIADFTGGKTDNFIDAATNKGEHYDNVEVKKNRKLKQRPGSVIYDSDAPQLPSGNARVDDIWRFNGTTFGRNDRNLYYLDSGSWSTLLGPSDSNKAFGKTTSFTGKISHDTWNNHLFFTIDDYQRPRKLYKDGSSNWQIRTAGLPALASAPVVTPDADDDFTYTWHFYYYYEYSVGSVTFIDAGPVYTVQRFQDAGDPGMGSGHYNQISSIPVLSNGADEECWDESNIKVKIYRTENGGSVAKYVGEITNGTTTFEDDVEDEDLGETIYTNGGRVSNDVPPKSKYFTIANDIGWYANITEEDGSIKPYRVRQSIPGDPDSCPASFFVDLDGDLTAISNVGAVPLAFTEDKVFRLEGAYTTTGGGAVIKREISKTVGCVSDLSIIRTDHGLFFAALDGFYYTDGYKVLKISDDYNTTYAKFVSTDAKKKNITGKLDKQTSRYYWAVESNGSGDNDAFYVFDETWGIRRDACFTTWNDQAQSDSFRPTAFEFINGNLVRGDTRGYLLEHNAIYRTDPIINTSASSSTWNTEPIIYNYTTVAMAFGTEFARKWITKVMAFFENASNISIQIKASNDTSNEFRDLVPIRYRGQFVWGDPNFFWGDPDFIWNDREVINRTRHMPAGTLRCVYKQLRFTNAEVFISTSDASGTASTDQITKKITLDDSVNNSWPLDCEGYSIYISSDSFSTPFEIIDRTSDSIIEVADDAGNLPDASAITWKIRGKPKDEDFALISFVIPYVVFGDSHPGYQTSESGDIGSAD